MLTLFPMSKQPAAWRVVCRALLARCRRPLCLLAGLLCGFAGLAAAARADVLPAGVAGAQAAASDALPAHSEARADPPGIVLQTPVHAHAQAGLAMAYGGVPVDVTTYHNDGLRTGWNPTETDLTPATVASSRFGLLKTLNVDGNVFAQPLMVSNFVMPDGSSHNVLLVATGHNTVYAFDAQTYAVLWQVNLGKSQSTADVGCNDVRPEYGITSTPVIMRTAPGKATVYLVAATEPSPSSFHTQLHALDLATGADLTPPTEIAPSATLSDGTKLGFDARNQWSRSGLVLANGSIYVSISSHCDNNSGAISGWLLRFGTNLAPTAAFHTIDKPAGTELASIWMTGFAPSVDASGNLYVTTGNGNFSKGGKDWGESVLKLPPALNQVADFFTPKAYRSLNNADFDFSSGGIMLLPNQPGQMAPPLAVTMGKDAVMYLLDQTNLGRLKAKDAGVLQSQRLGPTGSGVRGGPAYYAGPSGAFVYYQIDSDVLRSFAVQAGVTPALTLAAQGTTLSGYGGSFPIVSSNGAMANTAVVWLIRRASTLQLEAYDAVHLGAPIYSAAAGLWSNPSNNAFLSPLQANGRVYVPAYKTISVFGLTP